MKRKIINTATELTTKLGTAKGEARSRIWLQGPRLVASNFKPGAEFYAIWDAGDAKHVATLTLTRKKPTTFDDVRRVTGKGDVPIIDVVGAKVRDHFGRFTHVLAVFERGEIRIWGAAK